MIPIYNISLNSRDKKFVNKCLKTNWISSQGYFIDKLERRLANYHKMKYCLVTSSCTTALDLSIKSLDLKKGDEVICPALTFISPANMILNSNLRLVLIDIDPVTLTIDVEELKKKISKKTKALIVVNQFGHVADFDKIIRLSKKYNFKIIEDNAESLGARYKGKIAGSLGDVSTLSFFGNKIITTGEGGAILTNNKKIYKNCLLMRDHGMSKEKKYFHKVLGFNYRMTNMQAALGYSQMLRINKILSIRNKQFDNYKKYLKNNKSLKIRSFKKWCKGVHWLTTIHLKNKKIKYELQDWLKKNGVETRPMIFPVNFAKHIKKIIKQKFNNAAFISECSIHLPSGIDLSEKKIRYICKKINSFLEKK
mgnify:CR=1 FL=1|tara:strand:- start:2423 stop:3520 length:1098 start_codon:yes stop_codon:yes gene_type:complete